MLGGVDRRVDLVTRRLRSAAFRADGRPALRAEGSLAGQVAERGRSFLSGHPSPGPVQLGLGEVGQAPGAKADPPPKFDPAAGYDYWFAAAVEGERIGFLQWSAKTVDMNGRKLRHGTKYQQFVVDRFGQVVTQFAEESSVETPEGDEIQVRSYMNFSCSVDHRLADGADGARFLVYLKKLLETPGLLAM